jgi:uncharacterized membrane protein YqjE
MSTYDAPPGNPAGATSVDATTETESRSVGDIVGAITKDLSTLVKQELDLAKTELKQEAAKAGKGAGMLGGAGLAGYFTLLFLSVFLMFVLADWFDDYRWAALVVTGIWGIVAAVLALTGKKELQKVDPTLETTQRTLKEDVQWAKEQKSS